MVVARFRQCVPESRLLAERGAVARLPPVRQVRQQVAQQSRLFERPTIEPVDIIAEKPPI
jgi:hypothetical protein